VALKLAQGVLKTSISKDWAVCNNFCFAFKPVQSSGFSVSETQDTLKPEL